MTSAADTNILIDVLLADAVHGPSSINRLQTAKERGIILACDIVYAELAPSFGNRADLDAALQEIGVTVSPINTDIAFEAGMRWGQYRRAGGPRSRVLADFLIGAHALFAADAFLTRDRGFYATCFPELGNG